MKTIAVIPVHGRHRLLKHTIERLYKKNKVFRVICAGEEENRATCENAGAEFILHPNNSLGLKWNACFKAAEKYNPDACLFVGSSDWVCDEWLNTTSQLIMNEGFDLIGQAGFTMLDINFSTDQKLRACHWFGYGKGHSREHEPIGIGRVLSSRILSKLNWQPQTSDFKSADYWQLKKVKEAGGKIGMFDIGTALSISTNLWDNLHKFEQHWSNELPSVKLEVEPLLKMFPEALEV